MHAVLITGPAGSGRTSVLLLLVERAMAPVAGADLELITEGETAEDVTAQIRKTARL